MIENITENRLFLIIIYSFINYKTVKQNFHESKLSIDSSIRLDN
jgi:hypothetical protein